MTCTGVPTPLAPHASPLTHRADQLLVVDDERMLRDLKAREGQQDEKLQFQSNEYVTPSAPLSSQPSTQDLFCGHSLPCDGRHALLCTPAVVVRMNARLYTDIAVLLAVFARKYSLPSTRRQRRRKRHQALICLSSSRAKQALHQSGHSVTLEISGSRLKEISRRGSGCPCRSHSTKEITGQKYRGE